MAVIKEWKCMAHGFFEGIKPECPSGCKGEELIMRVFLTPVGTRSTNTKRHDYNLKNFAIDYGMSNIKSTREGEAQPARFAPPPENPYAVKWGNPQSIGSFNTKPIAGESVNGLELGKATGKIKPLQPVAVMHDHENLQIKTG